MTRGFILVMDSVGIGAAGDAERYGDAGANTLGHVAAARAGSERGPLRLPHLERLGLGAAAAASSGRLPAGFAQRQDFTGAWGYAVEQSLGKDTPSGHWEMAGVPVAFDWAYFPEGPPSFPAELTEALIARGGLPGLLGNRHASGTQIIEELGAEHLATGKPIVYTSADSVLQIAAHEESFGLQRLYALCRIARILADPYNIGRVIARPFVGAPSSFRRTAHRHDYAVPPPEPTLLDRHEAAGGTVIGIGKISDIFSGRGVSTSLQAADNDATFDTLLSTVRDAPNRSLILANFNDFDTLFGHRRDPAGYAAALEAFDLRLAELSAALRSGDLAIITADHGCDPTWRGTDHTREHVPVLAFGPGVTPRPLGRRESFADIGQSVAHHLGLPALPHGTSFV
ncbi:MAG: phosphopentomutase [Alphaproteobacteria bacterium]|nr:phosphopentomutase [Alphaproteobacteria bacterium]